MEKIYKFQKFHVEHSTARTQMTRIYVCFGLVAELRGFFMECDRLIEEGVEKEGIYSFKSSTWNMVVM